MRCASRASNGPNHLGLCALQGTVKASLEQALTRILTPKQSLDIVADIHQVTPIAGAGQCWHTAHPTMRWSAGMAGPLHSTANGPTWRQRRSIARSISDVLTRGGGGSVRLPGGKSGRS